MRSVCPWNRDVRRLVLRTAPAGKEIRRDNAELGPFPFPLHTGVRLDENIPDYLTFPSPQNRARRSKDKDTPQNLSRHLLTGESTLPLTPSCHSGTARALVPGHRVGGRHLKQGLRGLFWRGGSLLSALLNAELEEMGSRIEDLQKKVNELMLQAGIEIAATEQTVRPAPGNRTRSLPAGFPMTFTLKNASPCLSMVELLPLPHENSGMTKAIRKYSLPNRPPETLCHNPFKNAHFK